ncbi:hypothetical protein CDD82_4728 [Ophiocordyceps australis]|uniref:Peptidase A1 domain-containing protein n=1 Tax=Ophiocordyceps australis TaxID=1399860 RepID=A0A2C5YZ94_9HYPO|nr:hypothetical protein CDD82_4728 [Ophiocordyceps australis]
MKRPILPLLQLALWTANVSAFFPYTPLWLQEKNARVVPEDRRALEGSHDAQGFSIPIGQLPRRTFESPQERAMRDASRLSNKYQEGGNGGFSDLSKRGNTFDIMKAPDINKALSAAINQDGTDYAYFVQVQLGSKGKKFFMLIDTGAGSSWVMGSTCTDKACTMHDTFGPADSDTLETLPKDFAVSYGSGTVRGKMATDTISLAGVNFKYTFGLASKTSQEFTGFAFDGILGMSMNKGTNDNFFNKLSQAGNLDKNIFCVTLNRASDGVNNGEIRFGSTDPKKFTGDISYTPVESSDGDWSIRLDDVAYDGKKAQVGGVLSYIDTGTSFIFGPPEMVKKLHSVIPGAESSNDQTYHVPCDSKKSLTFTFSGVDYQVPAKDWISPKNVAGKCTSNIYGHEVAKGAWLLGDTFLKNVYTVFDRDQKRVGFANLATSGPESGAISSKISPPTRTANAESPTMGVNPHLDNSQQSTEPSAGSDSAESANGIESRPKETAKSWARGIATMCRGHVAATVSLVATVFALVV